MFARYVRALLLPGRGGGMPRRRLERAAAAEPARLARYAEVCGFRRPGPLPATYPQVLAFPLALDLMTRRDFPFRLPGLVHVANRVEQLRPLDPAERLHFAVEATGPAAHPRGTAFDLLTEARDGSGGVVWRSAATYLRRGPGGVAAPRGAAGPAAGAADPGEEPGHRERWHVPAGTGRRYAAVSGDRNPIHLHPLAARLLGFRGAIAHGMWTKARCLAAAERALPGGLPGAFTVRTAFRGPVTLPSDVEFTAVRRGTELAFELRAAGAGGHEPRRHLRGRIEAL
ncbi:MaoC family dehydratase [Streptomyces marincola]|nr:MaoC/PaaZ C-terminal domain-containing protein [Streptomyces marincola]